MLIKLTDYHGEPVFINPEFVAAVEHSFAAGRRIDGARLRMADGSIVYKVMENADQVRMMVDQANSIPLDTREIIGWRSADFLFETSDHAVARSWTGNMEILPIFAGDMNTKLPGGGCGGQ